MISAEILTYMDKHRANHYRWLASWVSLLVEQKTAIGGDRDIKFAKIKCGVNTQNTETSWRSTETYKIIECIVKCC